jgi:3D (Asp-Asp-Asp) domain-containing protein
MKTIINLSLLLILSSTSSNYFYSEDSIERKHNEIEEMEVFTNEIQELERVFNSIPDEPEIEFIGEFTLTAYCPCKTCSGKWGNSTSAGETATAGKTVATSWAVLPAYTEIDIDGLGKRIVHDKPATWIIDRYNGYIIDIYFDTHAEVEKFGKRTGVKVWITNRRNL